MRVGLDLVKKRKIYEKKNILTSFPPRERSHNYMHTSFRLSTLYWILYSLALRVGPDDNLLV